jgi:hypothetical protein
MMCALSQHVVPANAGIHTSCNLVEAPWQDLLPPRALVVMGPCVRRDDDN